METEPRYLSKTDRKTHRYVDDTGEPWVIKGYLVKKYSITYTLFLRYLPHLRQIPVGDGRGRSGFLYSEHDLDKLVTDFLSLPQVDKKTHRFTDVEGKSWITVGNFCARHDVSQYTLVSLIQDLNSLQGRDKSNHQVTLYNEEEVLAKIGSFLSHPRAQKKSGKLILRWSSLIICLIILK